METKSKGKKRVTTFDELIESRHGKIGTKKRTDFEIKAKSFAIGEIIKEERRLANMTQDELAEKTGTKKSFISRIETDIVTFNYQLCLNYLNSDLGEGYR
jgi:ribosome-binding protein aMBF1 (putative translation factor)